MRGCARAEMSVSPQQRGRKKGIMSPTFDELPSDLLYYIAKSFHLPALCALCGCNHSLRTSLTEQLANERSCI